MPTTLHFAGQADSSGIEYLIGERNVLAEMTAAGFGDGREIAVYQDGSCVCRGPAKIEVGSATGGNMNVMPECWIGGSEHDADVGYDVVGILDDADGFPIDLVVTDDPDYGS